MVVDDAWVGGSSVIASRIFGVSALVRFFQNGWLFDLDDPKAFHTAIDGALLMPDLAKELAAAGRRLVRTHYDATFLAGRMKNLYAQLIEEKHALRHHPRRRHECVDAA